MSHKLLQFVNSSTDLSSAISGTYNLWLVALSVLIASVAAYAALQIAERLSKSKTVFVKHIWLVSGAIAMGCGIWTMHFVGMLAFSLPMAVTYDLTITLVSILPGFIASAIALHFMSKANINIWRLNLGGVLMGVGIGAMHYTGMAAMVMDGSMSYDPLLFALSIVVAHVLATLSLYVKFVLAQKFDSKKAGPKFASAAIMGCAIAGMHYTGMSASYYFPGEGIAVVSQGLTPVVLGLSVTLASTIILAAAIISTMIDRRLQSASERIARFGRIFEDSLNEIYLFEADTLKFVQVNNAAQHNLGYTMAELQKLTPLDIKPEHTTESFAKLVAPLRKGEKEKIVFETIHERKDQSRYNVEVHLQLLQHEDETLFSAIILDITQRKQGETIQSVLFQISEATSMSGNLHELLTIIRKELGQLLDCTNFFVALYDAETEKYSFPYCVDEVEEDEDFTPQQLKKSLTDYVRRMGCPLLLDQQEHKELIKAGEVDLVGKHAKIWLGSPPKDGTGNHWRGCAAVIHQPDCAYTQADVELVSFVSDHIALAIERKGF